MFTLSSPITAWLWDFLLKHEKCISDWKQSSCHKTETQINRKMFLFLEQNEFSMNETNKQVNTDHAFNRHWLEILQYILFLCHWGKSIQYLRNYVNHIRDTSFGPVRSQPHILTAACFLQKVFDRANYKISVVRQVSAGCVSYHICMYEVDLLCVQ